MNSHQQAPTIEEAEMIPPTTGKDGINISGDTVTLATQHLDDEQRVLVRWAFDYARAKNFGWSETAQEYGLSTTVLYRLWTDKYRYPAEIRESFCPHCQRIVEIERGGQCKKCKSKTQERRKPHPQALVRISIDSLADKLQRAKRRAEERDAMGRLPFIETTIWRRVDKVCTEALDSQTIALIYGESQIGKTESVLEHQRRNNHAQTKYIRMPASGGVQLMMKEIARACRVNPDSSFEKLRERVFRAIDSTNLLVADEVHQCFVTYSKHSMLKCLEVLREIHDRTKCGMVLCGTNVLRQQLETGEFAQFLKQLRRRGVLELQLPAVPPKADINLIAAAYKLPAPSGESAALVDAIAKEYGLGRFIKFLGMGARHAKKKGQPYEWSHFCRAYDILARLRETEVA